MRSRHAVSLIELLIAAVLLGLVAALTIPRLGQAASEAPDTAQTVQRSLKVLRCAIEAYRQDHGVWPAVRGDGRHPPGSAAAFVAQLTRYTNRDGQVAAQADAEHSFGPYLRDGLPHSPLVPARATPRVLVVNQAPPVAPVAGDEAAWIFNLATGTVIANSTERDQAGRPYAQY